MIGKPWFPPAGTLALACASGLMVYEVARFEPDKLTDKETNRLHETMQHAAELVEREERFRKDLRGALTYPIILLIASVLVIAAMIFFLAPTLAPVFHAVKSDPPWLIHAMLAIRNVVVNWWLPIFGAFICLILSFVFVLRREGAKSSDFAVKIPLLGALIHESEAARSLNALGLLLASGAALPTSLSMVRDAATLSVFERWFSMAEEHVVAGGRLSDCLVDNDVIPPIAQQMIRAGEESNQLPKMLRHAAETLDARTARRMQALLQVLTPSLTIIIGLIVGGLIFSTLSAVLDINELAFR